MAFGRLLPTSILIEQAHSRGGSPEGTSRESDQRELLVVIVAGSLGTPNHLLHVEGARKLLLLKRTLATPETEPDPECPRGVDRHHRTVDVVTL